MRFSILFFAAMCMLVASCTSESGGDKPKTLTTANGFEYIHHIANEGEKGQPGQYAYFHVYIRTNDSLTYSSRDQGTLPKIAIPKTENSSARPSAVTDILTIMTIGDSVTVFQPVDTTRSKGVARSISYDVVLFDLKSAAEYRADYERERQEEEEKRNAVMARVPEIAKMVEERAELYKAGQLDDQIQTTETGLKIMIHEQGNGPAINPRDQIKVHYYGALTNGSMFDNSFERGSPYPVTIGIGQVIKGWDQGITMLNKGGKATLFIPAALGYGATGSPPKIPGNSELIFYVEVSE